MTYVDITLTPAATYTYVHNGQIYDQIATTLGAHGAWQYVEFKDAINGADTYRRHVWRCKAASSGLPSDFYVMFQTKFITATGVYSTVEPVYFLLAEGYSSGTLSKMASNQTSIIPASDLTNPATWTLTTYTSPTTIFWKDNSNHCALGPSGVSVTSVRLLYIVAKDGLFSNYGVGSASSGATAIGNPIYVGAYDTLLGVNDPMPIAQITYYSASSTLGSGACTRAPLQTVGVAVTEVFCTTNNWIPSTGNIQLGSSSALVGSLMGVLGSPTNTNWPKSHGGAQVVRGWISSLSQTATTNSSKALVRGNPKYVRIAQLASHSPGDTFLVDGKVYVGLGSYTYGIWDTTAA